MTYKWNHNFPRIAREAGFKIKETREIGSGQSIDWRVIGEEKLKLIAMLIYAFSLKIKNKTKINSSFNRSIKHLPRA